MNPPPRRILIVDDDAEVAELLGRSLRAQGYATSVVGNGLEVAGEVRRLQPSLVLLDLSLPGQDGIEVCRELRRFSSVPIIMVTARAEEGDRVLGLEVGADDYVCKQFSAREVLARVNALLRRQEGHLPGAAAAQGFQVDEEGQRIAWQGQWLPLTLIEFRLLRQLVLRPGQVFSRAQLLEIAHADDGGETTDRAIDSHVKNLRRKIAAVRPQGSAIVSVYGVGYRFDPDEGFLHGSSTV
jgi:two-component system, OmpR family, response regulator BaeR